MYLPQKLIGQLASLEVQAARPYIKMKIGTEMTENITRGDVVIQFTVPAGSLQHGKTLATGAGLYA